MDLKISTVAPGGWRTFTLRPHVFNQFPFCTSCSLVLKTMGFSNLCELPFCSSYEGGRARLVNLHALFFLANIQPALQEPLT